MDPLKSRVLTEGPVGPTLARLTGYMVFGFFATIAFNLVDAWFVARLGTRELAAMGFTFPVVMIVGAIAIGLGVGTAALVSRAIGEGNRDQVQRLTTDALSLSLFVVMLFVVAGFFTIEPVFRVLGADDATLPLVKQYMRVWYPGMMFLVIPMVGNNAIRATGDMKSPSVIMMVSVVINVGLDPLLIFGIGPFPRMELAGAALATVIARACTLVLSLWILHYRNRMLTFVRPGVAGLLASWRDILFIGVPAAGTNLIRPLGAAVFTAITARFGHEAVAAYGVATRVDAFAFIVLIAMAVVLGPFIGQNLGAGQLDRVQKVIEVAHRFALFWGWAVAVLLFVLAYPVARLFSSDPGVVGATVLYLRMVPVGYGLMGVFGLSNAALNVLRRPWIAALLAGVQMFGLAVPAALVGARVAGLAGVFAAVPLSAMVAGSTGRAVLLAVLRRLAAASVSAPPCRPS